MPISYDNAFGGVDDLHPNPVKHRTFPLNHVGRGYYESAPGELVHGKPLPNTEEADRPVTSPKGKYAPMSFGPLGRAWEQRINWAGTYDESWLEHQYPFLPQDFDARYFQCAPADQQMEYPTGGEEIWLTNLSPQEELRFRLPQDLRLSIRITARDGRMTDVPASVDTVVIEPDQSQFSLVWRAQQAIRRTIREVREITVGQTIEQFQRSQRTAVKRRFRSLDELVDSRRRSDVRERGAKT
jgi:hypothetical protein